MVELAEGRFLLATSGASGETGPGQGLLLGLLGVERCVERLGKHLPVCYFYSIIIGVYQSKMESRADHL